MKNLFLRLSILMVLSLSVLACEKEDNDTVTPSSTQPEQISGTYKLYMDGNLVAEGSTTEVGMVQNLQQEYTNSVTMSKGEEVSLLLNGFSLVSGQEVTIDDNGGPGLTIMGKNLVLSDDSDEMYFAKSGTITRTSGSKISFEGSCNNITSTNTHTFNGYIDSEAYEQIK